MTLFVWRMITDVDSKVAKKVVRLIKNTMLDAERITKFVGLPKSDVPKVEAQLRTIRSKLYSSLYKEEECQQQ